MRGIRTLFAKNARKIKSWDAYGKLERNFRKIRGANKKRTEGNANK